MSNQESVLVSGVTGLVGRRLAAALAERGTPLRALTRRPGRAGLASGSEAWAWNGIDVPEEAVRGAGAVVHLSGEPIFGGLPTAARRERMHASRVLSTESLVAVMGRLPASERPDVLVCASAVGYYGSRGEECLSEDAAPGSGFLAELCRDWEGAARGAAQHGVRVVSLRIGIVLAREGGALGAMLRPFRLGLGGRIGSGRQWMPWIQADDLVRLIEAVRENTSAEGPVNAVAPEAVRNRDFVAAIARRLGRPAVTPLPAFVVRAVLGELAGEFLASRRVVPERAAALGFRFLYPDLERALAEEI